ncbi:MAG: HrpB1 family type III secretion system apparatus protein, partial [Anaerolineales bacterium]|nr:HrpB1 family type III secretion system apparatus protein [Anaerolineales bacterium]
APKLQELVKQLKLLRPNAVETLYLDFRLKFVQGDYDGAIDLVRELNNLSFDDGIIPLTKGDLDALSTQLPYWKPVLELPATHLPVKINLQLQDDPGQFSPAPLADFADGKAYQVHSGAVARYEIENTTNARAHLYFVTVAPHGRITTGPLLDNDDARIEGLASGATGYSQKFQIKELPGIVQNRILFAPQRVSELLFPAILAVRGVDFIEPGALARVQMQPVFYQIVSENISLDARAIRDEFSSLVLHVDDDISWDSTLM